MARSSNPLPWLLVGLIGLAALVGGLWILMGDDAPERDPELVPPPSRGAPDAPRVRPPAPIDRPEVGEPVTPPAELTVGTLTGRLVNDQGNPVGPARMEAFEGSSISLTSLRKTESLDVITQAGEDGRFRMDGVPVSNVVTLFIEGKGFAPTSSDLFTVGPGEVTDVGDIVVDRGVRVFGRVLDPQGRPIPGAQVGYFHSTSLTIGRADTAPEPDLVQLTDDRGGFSFEHVTLEPFQLLVSADGFATQIFKPHMVELQYGDGSYENTVYMQPELLLRGSVHDKATGEPLSGLTVTALPTGTTISRGSTLSADDGSFVLRGLSQGFYKVYAEGPGWVANHVLIREDEFGVEEPEIFLEPSGNLRGVVVGPEGEAVRKFDIHIRWASSQNGSPSDVRAQDRVTDGEFAFDDLLPGWWTFEVWAPGYAPLRSQPARLESGQDLRIEVALKPASILRGLVVDVDNEPIAGARLALRANDYLGVKWLGGDGSDAIWYQETRTDKNGRWELANVMRGRYQVEATHPSYAVTRVNDVSAAPGRARELDDIVLDRAGILTGYVLDARGNPLPRAEVSCGGNRFGGGKIAGFQTVTNHRGEYTFRGLEPGVYTVEAWRKETDGFQMLEPMFKRVGDHMQGAGTLFVDVLPGQVTRYDVDAWDN